MSLAKASEVQTSGPRRKRSDKPMSIGLIGVSFGRDLRPFGGRPFEGHEAMPACFASSAPANGAAGDRLRVRHAEFARAALSANHASNHDQPLGPEVWTETRHRFPENVTISGTSFLSGLKGVPMGKKAYVRKSMWRKNGRTPSHTGILDDPYTNEETEFMLAVDRYKREHQRPFPTFAEILAVAKSLGYRKAQVESTQDQEATSVTAVDQP